MEEVREERGREESTADMSEGALATGSEEGKEGGAEGRGVGSERSREGVKSLCSS